MPHTNPGKSGPRTWSRWHRTAAAHGIRLTVAQLPAAKQGFGLLPRRWVVARSFAWKSRFRRLVRDDKQLTTTLAGLHFVAFAVLMLQRFISLFEVHNRMVTGAYSEPGES